MSKAYVITKVIHSEVGDDEPHAIGVLFDREDAEASKVADMRKTRAQFAEDTIFDCREDLGVITFKEGPVNSIVWNVEEVEISIPSRNNPK